MFSIARQSTIDTDSKYLNTYGRAASQLRSVMSPDRGRQVCRASVKGAVFFDVFDFLTSVFDAFVSMLSGTCW